jgi:hypothetical protein
MTVLAADFPWAALGAFMAGIGSVLSGIAAIKAAGRKKESDAKASGTMDGERPSPSSG